MKSAPPDLESKLTRFIVENLLDDDLAEGVDPLTEDVIDSLGLGQLVDYIETEFDVSVDDEEMVRKNFASIATLAAFVESKRRSAAR